MKERFFKLAAKENFPNTPGITKELDELQETIKANQPPPSEIEIPSPY